MSKSELKEHAARWEPDENADRWPRSGGRKVVTTMLVLFSMQRSLKISSSQPQGPI